MARPGPKRSIHVPSSRRWPSYLTIVLLAGTTLSPWEARAQTPSPSPATATATTTPTASPTATTSHTMAPISQATATSTPSAARAAGETPLRAWHFADGNSRSQFQTYFMLVNLSDQPASVTAQYSRDDGIRLVQWLGIEPRARLSVDANAVVGERSFGASFFADQDIVVERSTTWGPGQNGLTTLGFAPDGERVWHFAEGTTRGRATTYFVTQNLSDDPTNVTATFVRDNGAPESRSFWLAPRARDAFRVNDLLTDTAFSATFRSDRDVVVERTIMTEADRAPTSRQNRGRNGQTDEGSALGANAVGILGGLGYPGTADQAGSRTWQFAEGSTRIPYQTLFILFNPSAQSTEVRLRFRLESGDTKTRSLWVPGQGRTAIDPRDTVQSADFSTSIEADVPIVVERTYVSSGDGLYGALGYTASAAPRDSRDWYFAEGNTNSEVETYFVLYNLSDRSTQVKGTFYADGASPREQTLDVPAGGRRAIRANDFVPGAFFSARFRADQNIVAERTFYLPGGSGFTTIGTGIAR